MKIFWRVFWIMSVAVFFELIALWLFTFMHVEVNIIATLMTAITIFTGYFISHDLEVLANTKGKKLELYLNVIKNLRILLNEPYYLGKEKQKEFRDQFIDFYYQFSLLSTKKSYLKLEAAMERFGNFLSNPNSEEYKSEFKRAQSELINQMRKELDNEEEIEFGGYAIQLPGEK